MRLAFNGIATLELFMNIKTNTLSFFLFSALLSGCGGDESPFGPPGSSSTNIISAINLGLTASELEPQVIEFEVGTVIGSAQTTANIADVKTVWGNVSSEITITAADNSGALVSSGTVFFATQYGLLSASSCQLQEGTCTVTWSSIANLNNLYVSSTVVDIRNVIVAWTYGSEGFIDLDGDDQLSDSELFFDTDEPYLDRNDNYTYDAATDDTIVDNAHDGGNSVFNGPNCDSTTRTDCGSNALIPIYDRVYLRLDFDATTANVLEVTIDAPANNFTIANGTNIVFSATATDPEDGTIVGTSNPLAGNDVVWSSDLDGNIGSGDSVSTSTLTVGTHLITVTVTDSDTNTVSTTITVIIT